VTAVVLVACIDLQRRDLRVEGFYLSAEAVDDVDEAVEEDAVGVGRGGSRGGREVGG
jgi:hypothetical protein